MSSSSEVPLSSHLALLCNIFFPLTTRAEERRTAKTTADIHEVLWYTNRDLYQHISANKLELVSYNAFRTTQADHTTAKAKEAAAKLKVYQLITYALHTLEITETSASHWYFTNIHNLRYFVFRFGETDNEDFHRALGPYISA